MIRVILSYIPLVTTTANQEKGCLPQKRIKKTSWDILDITTVLEKNDLKSLETKNHGKPLDGGWGWVIVFASLMCNIVFGKLKILY